MLATISVGRLELPAYALLGLLGLLAAIPLAVCNASRRGLAGEDVFYASLYGCFGLVAGGKLLYLLTILPALLRNWQQLSQNSMQAVGAMLSGGFVFYGGLFGAMGGVYLYGRQYRVSAMALLDVFAPSVPAFHFFGRIGCWLAGCCYGVPYQGPGAVQMAGQLRFPVQLAEAGVNLMLAALLLWYLRREERHGRVMGGYLCLYGVARLLLEFLRGDAIRGFWFGVSTSQWMSLAAVGTGLWLLLRTADKKCRNMKIEY